MMTKNMEIKTKTKMKKFKIFKMRAGHVTVHIVPSH